MWVEGFVLLMSSTLVNPKPRFPSVIGVFPDRHFRGRSLS